MKLCLLTRRRACKVCGTACSDVLYFYREGRELPGIYHTGIMALCATWLAGMQACRHVGWAGIDGPALGGGAHGPAAGLCVSCATVLPVVVLCAGVGNPSDHR